MDAGQPQSGVSESAMTAPCRRSLGAWPRRSGVHTAQSRTLTVMHREQWPPVVTQGVHGAWRGGGMVSILARRLRSREGWGAGCSPVCPASPRRHRMRLGGTCSPDLSGTVVGPSSLPSLSPLGPDLWRSEVTTIGPARPWTASVDAQEGTITGGAIGNPAGHPARRHCRPWELSSTFPVAACRPLIGRSALNWRWLMNGVTVFRPPGTPNFRHL